MLTLACDLPVQGSSCPSGLGWSKAEASHEPLLPRPNHLCFAWAVGGGEGGGGGLKEASGLWVGPGLLSPSQEEEQRVAVQDEGDTGGGVISVSCFQGDREMPLSGRPLGLPLAWGQRDQAEEPEWREEGWGRDVT